MGKHLSSEPKAQQLMLRFFAMFVNPKTGRWIKGLSDDTAAYRMGVLLRGTPLAGLVTMPKTRLLRKKWVRTMKALRDEPFATAVAEETLIADAPTASIVQIADVTQVAGRTPLPPQPQPVRQRVTTPLPSVVPAPYTPTPQNLIDYNKAAAAIMDRVAPDWRDKVAGAVSMSMLPNIENDA